jgi:hypothetical protein
MLTAALGTNDFTPVLYRSTDGGITWTEQGLIWPQLRERWSMFVSISRDATGRLFLFGSRTPITQAGESFWSDATQGLLQNDLIWAQSSDGGRSWTEPAVIPMPIPGAAEASYLGAEHPNAYALSHDGGTTWQPTRSTGILGQSTGLAALPDGRALFIYNQRRHGEPGVWLAVVRPSDTDFGIESNEIVWRAQTRTQTGTSGDHVEWSDFSFGEPSVTLLSDETLLVALWSIQPSGRGIRYVRLKWDH